MRSDEKSNACNRQSRSRAAVSRGASFGSTMGKIIESINNRKSCKNVKRNSSAGYNSSGRREISEPRLVTPKTTSSVDRNVKKTSVSNSIPLCSKLSLSTPRRKRDLLAILHSDLSPKYIGFTTPPSSSVAACDGSQSDDGLQTRSTRSRKYLLCAASPDIGGSDSEVLTDTSTSFLACVRRTRNTTITPSPTPVSTRKGFVSPIEKLLARNGSIVLKDTSKENIVNNLDVIPNTINPKDEIDSEAKDLPLNEVYSSTNCENIDCADVAQPDERQDSTQKTNKESVENGFFSDSEENAMTSVSNDILTENQYIASKSKDISKENELASEKNEKSFENNVIISEKNEPTKKDTSQLVIKIKTEISKDEQDNYEQIYDAKEQGTSSVEIKADNLKKTQIDLDSPEEDIIVNPFAIMKTEGGVYENMECPSESIESHDLDNSQHILNDAEGGESGESMILNNAVGLSAKSPSAASLDSAKGSSIVTSTHWVSYTTGEIFWGQIYTYCYWPCIVCPDPNGKTIITEQNTRNSEEYELVHVRFFADSGRRNWVKRENLIPYIDLESYKQKMREIRKKYGKKSVKYKLLLPKPSKVMIWREAIKEANKVAELLHEERLAKFFEMYEHKKGLLKLKRKPRKLSLDNTSSTSSLRLDSMENLNVKNSLSTVKRDRSASPYSPAYSPLKPISNNKRRKLSDASTQNSQAPENSFVENIEQNNESNYNSRTTGEANTSNSFTALHETDLQTNDEYRNFYSAMKDFVLENNKDDSLEKSLTVAVRNIWALKQINRQQMQRRLLLSANKYELGSSIIETTAVDGMVKRLSNRLKTLKYRHSLPATNKSTTIETPNNNQSLVRVPKSVDSKPKRQLNRPIEEVIDDIFNLDNKYLFRGLARDPVCKYCFHPGGALYKCAKGCQSWMHEDCIGLKATDIAKKKKIPFLRKSSTSHSKTNSLKSSIDDKSSLEKQNNQMEIEPKDDVDATALSITTYHVTADAETENTAVEKSSRVVICDTCAQGKVPTCAVCGKDNSSEELVVCNMTNCAGTFHPSCCRYWPQAKFTKSKNQIETFRCPSHVCHTCVSDDPKGKFQHLSNSKLTKCVQCPASYHMDSTCIPAGSQILSAAHIICPRHSSSNKSDGHVNVSWCFICVGGGQVVCCETCPTAVHAKCLNIALDPSEGYICEECESGRLPLYGEMVWAKFTSFRWWPAIILPPTEIPQNIRRKPHNPNEFVVRFFGTHDHGWISRRRVYLYLEGDSSEPPKSRSGLDHSYNKGVEEAKRFYDIIKSKKLAQRLSNENKEKLHPQPYVRIKANRAVLPVKLHADLDKVNKCECKFYDDEPCGPNSNCLNRVLYHECNPKVCPAGDRCQNQMFESRLSPRLDVVYLKERGFGLVCREPIQAGDFVIEYVGEIIDDNEFKQRISQKSLDRDENFYFLSVEKDYIIDAGPKGNLARFMNHSCDPNCETQKWLVNGLNRIGLFAIKDIPADTELTFNYHWDDLLGNQRKLCLCGATKCVGEIGGKTKEEKVSKENLALFDVSKIKSSKASRKSLKRLQNRNGEDNRKKGAKRRSNVSIKTTDKNAKSSESSKSSDGERIGDGNSFILQQNAGDKATSTPTPTNFTTAGEDAVHDLTTI